MAKNYSNTNNSKMQAGTAATRQTAATRRTAKTAEGHTMLLMSLTAIKAL